MLDLDIQILAAYFCTFHGENRYVPSFLIVMAQCTYVVVIFPEYMDTVKLHYFSEKRTQFWGCNPGAKFYFNSKNKKI